MAVSDRTNKYTFDFYPTFPNSYEVDPSLIDLLDDFLANLLIPSARSPLHDKDVNPDGTPKKPHFHVALFYSSVKSAAQFYENIEPIVDYCAIVFPYNSSFFGKFKATHWVKCERTLIRYFAHLDNPDKFQYDFNDIKAFGGYDPKEAVLSDTDKISFLKEIIQWCQLNDVYSYKDLLDYCLDYNDDWFRTLASRSAFTFMVKEYLWSNFQYGTINRRIEEQNHE